MLLSDLQTGLAEIVTIGNPTPTCDIDSGSWSCSVQMLLADLMANNAIIVSNDPANWKTPAGLLATLLASIFGSDLVIGTNLFIGFEPAVSVDCFTLYDMGGTIQPPINSMDECNIQITAKAASYPDGYNKLNQIKAVLQSIPSVTIDGERIVGIWMTSNIAVYGKDQNDNSLFTSNYRVIIDTQKDINRPY